MPNVNMELVQIGQQYTAKQLAEMWGYQSHHALIKGVITPSGKNIIILFVTKEKQQGATPYEDDLRGNILYMMGQEKHGTDGRLLANLNNPADDIFLFYREKHHTPFVYYGRCFLINAKIKDTEPSEFEFLIETISGNLECEIDILDYFVNVPANESNSAQLFIDGSKHITQHVKYERNPYNRKEAIRIHGHKCKICGFDFNDVYGKDLADDYIEIHHIKPLAEGIQLVDPEKDLIPVCSNCHRMLHRKRKNNISIFDLRQNNRVIKYKDMIKNMTLSE